MTWTMAKSIVDVQKLPLTLLLGRYLQSSVLHSLVSVAGPSPLQSLPFPEGGGLVQVLLRDVTP